VTRGGELKGFLGTRDHHWLPAMGLGSRKERPPNECGGRFRAKGVHVKSTRGRKAEGHVIFKDRPWEKRGGLGGRNDMAGLDERSDNIGGGDLK